MTILNRSLTPEHEAAVRTSGISADVIAARGYWSARQGDAESVRRSGHTPEIAAHGAAMMLPLHDVHGAVALTVARPDVPRLDGRGRPKKYEIPRGAKATLDVPPMVRAALSDPEARLWITEGQKKADAAVSAGAGCVIAVLGVWNWKRYAIAAWETVTLRNRTVYLAFDSDAATNPKVSTALRRLKAFLGSRGAQVRIVHLAPGPDGRKVGLDDALAAGATLDQLAARSTDDLRVHMDPDDKRPELDVTVLHHAVTLAAFPHLARAEVYRVGGGLVRVENEDGALALRPVRVPELRAILSRAVRCVRHSDRGTLPTYPPRDLAEIMAHDPTPPVPALRAVVASPTFTADGRYLDRPGYDVASQLLLAFGWSPRPVPKHPTADEIAEARRWWDAEALADFPFSSSADQTAALALALTPLVRDMIAGPTPLFGVDASVRGAGKGKLARVCLIPSLGPGGCTVAALPREEEETRKALTAYLRERRLAVVFDNVAGRIGSAVLAKALTEPVWDDRTLGKSESVRYPVRCVWVVTANNPSYSDEIGRRLVPIRLVPQTDRPELREGFKHPELEAWVTANRADLLWSLAVFVRAWQAAGCPAPHARLGSYETWTRVVGGILETVGYTDLLANREEILAAADPDTAAWESFLAAWWETHEDRYVAVRDLLALAEPHGVRVNGDGDRAQSASLGMALGSRRDRFFGVWQVKKGEGSRRREWRLHRPMTPSVTYDTSPSNSLRGGKTISNDAMQITLPRYTPGKEVAEVSEGVMSHADALALTWGRVVEAEERLEREAIQAEAAA